MKLSDQDIYRMSNLAEWKLKELIATYKHRNIVMHEIIRMAQAQRQMATLKGNTLLANKFEDLVESVSNIQKQLQEAE